MTLIFMFHADTALLGCGIQSHGEKRPSVQGCQHKALKEAISLGSNDPGKVILNQLFIVPFFKGICSFIRIQKYMLS